VNGWKDLDFGKKLSGFMFYRFLRFLVLGFGVSVYNDRRPDTKLRPRNSIIYTILSGDIVFINHSKTKKVSNKIRNRI